MLRRQVSSLLNVLVSCCFGVLAARCNAALLVDLVVDLLLVRRSRLFVHSILDCWRRVARRLRVIDESVPVPSSCSGRWSRPLCTAFIPFFRGGSTLQGRVARVLIRVAAELVDGVPVYWRRVSRRLSAVCTFLSAVPGGRGP